MVTPFQWLTLASATQQIQNRLNDAGIFWTVTEVQAYLLEALRVFNALTEWNRQDFTFNATGGVWINFGTVGNSPRFRTVTDSQLATNMENMLLEPPVGIGTWLGTNQFSVQKIQQALAVRREEVIQHGGTNTVNLAPINSTPNTRRVQLTDTALEIRRVRFFSLLTSNPNTYAISYMKKSDLEAFHRFNSDWNITQGPPQRWSMAAEPPLSFDVDNSPDTEGYYDVLVLQSGPEFSTTPSLLGLPDDWSWLPMYGALADLLSEEPESTDRQRAAYCLKRYTDGLQMMRESNWFTQAFVNGVVADTPSLETKDRWSIGWQEDTGGIPGIVTDGIDQLNASPATAVSVQMNVVANAPFLDSTNTYVQVARDDWDQVLNYTQHVASFKMGGPEFQSTLPLLDEFFKYCRSRNRRNATYGLYVDVLNLQGMKQDIELPREVKQ
jgi:hypothetical protein